MLPSWDPRNIDDVAALAPTLPYPILIKPRTHVHRLRNDKGVVVHSAPELIDQYQRFVDREQARAADTRFCPMPACPSCNNLSAWGARVSIRSRDLSIGRESCSSRAAQPRCFSDPNPWELGFALNRCHLLPRCQMPFAASVESSVISESSRSNFSGSMGVGRQSTSTRACLIRSGWTSAEVCRFRFSPALMLRVRPHPCAMQSRRRRQDDDEQAVFCDRFTLRAILLAQTVTARISRKDRAYWRAWMKQHAAHAVDFAAGRQRPNARGYPCALGNLSGPQILSAVLALDCAHLFFDARCQLSKEPS